MRPCLRLNLFAGIRPEITVMEIQKNSHPRFRHLLSHPDHMLQAVLPCAIGNTLLRIGIIPQPQPDGIHIIIFHNFQNIFLRAVIIILRAAFLQLPHAGEIHSFNKLTHHILLSPGEKTARTESIMIHSVFRPGAIFPLVTFC